MTTSTHLTPLHAAAADAVATRAGVPADTIKVDAPPNAALGDFAVGCFAIAKAKGQSPAQAAQEIAAAFQPTELLAGATAAGPFVNFRANRAAAFRWIVDASTHGTLLPTPGADKTICIDFGSPNISKHLAYHHIRSTTIGHSLVHIFRALGYRVIGINHLGDWGTTHGALIAAYKKWGATEPLDVEQLNVLYVRFTTEAKAEAAAKAKREADARAKLEADLKATLEPDAKAKLEADAKAKLEADAKAQPPSLDQVARDWFKKIEQGDPEARALWQRFRDVSWAEYQEVYDLLGITYDEVRGESAYEPDLARVMKELRDKGLVVESKGAQVVFLEGEKTPILLEKGDGTTLYATRDVAAAEYRWNTYHPTRSLYVVDRGQSLHFRQLFKLLALAGHAWASVCEHIPFGLVLTPKPEPGAAPEASTGGRKARTRLGNVVLMRDVFAIAQDEVREIMTTANPDLSPDVATKVAREVGIGAVVFANLASQRDKDFEFDLDKATSLSGDSGPYLQYSHARCASIMRKAGADQASMIDFTKLADPALLAAHLGDKRDQFAAAEWAVARRLFELPDIVVRAGNACEPHAICHYLLELAGDFSRWYTFGNTDPSLRVLCEDAPTRHARLALVTAVQAALHQGLSLLGLAAPDQM